MKILALMTVKNEDDIIREAIEDALQWADYIVIMDNGSSDNTLNIINEVVSIYENVIFWGVYGGPFHDWIRSLMYNDYRHLIKEGDWVCRLDADEFYIDNPKTFLNNIKTNSDVVYSASFQYYFTEKDFNTNLSLPANFRMKYYACNHSEERLFKVKKNTFWPISRGWPLGLFRISHEKIRLKHFQYRTEEQMKKRFEGREVVNLSKNNTNLFIHEHRNNKVMDSTQLKFDDGKYTFDSDQLPHLKSPRFLKKSIIQKIHQFLSTKMISHYIHPNTKREK